MFKHLLKYIFRNQLKNWPYTLINILGLALGLVSIFFILIYVLNELSVDKHFKDSDRIYRVLCNHEKFGMQDPNAPYVLSDLILAEIPGVESASSMRFVRNSTARVKDENIYIRRTLGVQPQFFSIFPLDLIAGERLSLLDDIFDIVLSETLAEKLFPGKNAVGQTLLIKTVDGKKNFRVSGVFRDFPQYSSLQVDAFTHIEWPLRELARSFSEGALRNEMKHGFFSTYLKLSDHANLSNVNEAIHNLSEREKQEKDPKVYYLQNLEDIYLHSHEISNNHYHKTGDIGAIKLFSSLAVMILLIAGFNFIILFIARASSRYRDIGLRRVIGAGMKNIRMLAFMESALTVLLAFLLSLFLLQIFMKSVEDLFAQKLYFNLQDSYQYLLYFLVIIFIIIIASSAYMAFYYGLFKPVDILRNQIAFKSGKVTLSRMLTGFQIAIFIALVISTLVVYRQMSFVKNKDMGFKSNNLLVVHLDGKLQQKYKAFRDELKLNPYIENISAAMILPPSNSSMRYSIKLPDNPQEEIIMEGTSVDYGFFKTMEIPLLEGRAFSREFATDSSDAVILNETAVKKLHIKNPVGEEFNGRKVIGVVKDFNLHSLHSAIPPISISISKMKYLQKMVIRYKQGYYEELRAFVKQKANDITQDPNLSIAKFKDVSMELYKKEMHLANILVFFSVLAVLIAIMGLFGLSLYQASRRTKEIGIRKVHGAETGDIVKLFAMEYFWLVFIALILASPVAFYFMKKWLQQFAFHTNISWIIFVLAGTMALLIVLLTISFHALRAARTNPVKTLNYE